MVMFVLRKLIQITVIVGKCNLFDLLILLVRESFSTIYILYGSDLSISGWFIHLLGYDGTNIYTE